MAIKKPLKTKSNFKKMLLINSVAIFTGAAISTPLIFASKNKKLNNINNLNLAKSDGKQSNNSNASQKNLRFAVGKKEFQTEQQAKDFILSKFKLNNLYKFNDKKFDSKKSLWDYFFNKNKINSINLNDDDVYKELSGDLNFTKKNTDTNVVEKKKVWVFNEEIFQSKSAAKQAQKSHETSQLPFTIKLSNIKEKDDIFFETEKIIDYSKNQKSFIPEVADIKNEITTESSRGSSTYVQEQKFEPGISEVSISDKKFNLINFNDVDDKVLEKNLEIQKQDISQENDTLSLQKSNFRFLLDRITFQSDQKLSFSSINKDSKLFLIKAQELQQTQIAHNDTVQFKFSNYMDSNSKSELKSEIVLKIKKNIGHLFLVDLLREKPNLFSLKDKYILFNLDKLHPRDFKVHLEKITYGVHDKKGKISKIEVLNDLQGISLKDQNWKISYLRSYSHKIKNYAAKPILKKIIMNGGNGKIFMPFKNIETPNLTLEMIKQLKSNMHNYQKSKLLASNEYLKITLSKNYDQGDKEFLSKLKFFTWYNDEPKDELEFILSKEILKFLMSQSASKKLAAFRYWYKIKNTRFLYDSNKNDKNILKTKLKDSSFEKEGLLHQKVYFNSNSEDNVMDSNKNENIKIKKINDFQLKIEEQPETAKDKFKLKYGTQILDEISVTRKSDGSNADNPYENLKVEILISQDQLQKIKDQEEKLKIQTIFVDASKITGEANQKYNESMNFSAKKYWYIESDPQKLFLTKNDLNSWYKKNMKYSSVNTFSFNNQNYESIKKLFEENIKVIKDANASNVSIKAQYNYK